MDDKHTHRRTYGYRDQSTSRTRRTYGESQNHGKTYRRTNEQPLAPRWLVSLLIFPFQLTGWVLKLLWRMWDGRPRLRKERKQQFWKRFTTLCVTLFVFGFLGGTVMVAWVSKDLPDPDRLTDRKVAQSTKIYDRTGQHVLYEIFSDKKRTLVEYDQIPQTIIDALIATEDTKFYEHNGIRPLSILRSIVYGALGKGSIGGGASTLTQQLVKNAILTNERTVTRKLKEIILSIRLEQKYSKQQILKIYFNEIPYGSTNYGVESAAQSYFGKTVSDLDLQESATLAGIPKAPSRYLSDPKALKERRDFVLRRMFEEGYIDEQTMRDTQALPLTLERHIGNIRAPHFSLSVRDQLATMFDEQTVDTGGLRVITTLDWGKQQIAENAVAVAVSSTLLDAGADNASLVAMDPRTGQVLAMVGSADFYNDAIAGQFNVATLGKRQPGSSFKPIIYAAAFEKGYTPDTVLYDVKTNFAVSGKPYQPLNYNLKELGPVSIRQALQGSLNIPAVKALYLVGAEKGVEFAQRLGYSTFDNGNFGLSLVLGGGEVTLMDHVHAYSIFANGGIKYEPVSILKVEDYTGDVLYEWKKPRGEHVLDEGLTATISNILSDDGARAYAFGAGGVLTLPGRPVAAKTGTTNAYVDGWTIGYTPSLVAGVWVGNTDNTPMNPGNGGSRVGGPIWNQFMREALENTAIEAFPNPPINDAEKPALRGSTGGQITLFVNKLTEKLATSSTPPAYVEQRTYIQPHSILHYVDKNDPRGPTPTDPATDPQYQIWEDAIQDWVRRTKEANPDWNMHFEEPPTEKDEGLSSELAPTLEVIHPTGGETLRTRQIDSNIQVSAPRGVSKVSYRLDSTYIDVVRQPPFNLSYFANGIEDGPHTLTIIVEDDIGNRTEQSIPFTLSAGIQPPNVTWIETRAMVLQNTFPWTTFLTFHKLNEITSIDVYGEHNGTKTQIGSINPQKDLFNNQLRFVWMTAPEPGEWTLTARAVVSGLDVFDSRPLHVVVQ